MTKKEPHENKLMFDDNPREAMEPLLRWFQSAHLPAPLKEMMVKFRFIADEIVVSMPPSAERTIALRKLIEAKDAAIRGLVDLQRPVPTSGEGTGGGNG